jgi:asparagine synthase (glutamine-hydrolysing)
MKADRSGTKRLLRAAVADWLPPGHVSLPKRGFGVPVADWLRTDLRDMARDLLTDDTARSRGLFRTHRIEQLLAEHARGQNHSRRLWALMQFELWARTWLDQSAAPVAAAPCP